MRLEKSLACDKRHGITRVTNLDGQCPQSRGRLRPRLEVRPLRALSAYGSRRVRSSWRTVHQRSGPDRHGQPHGSCHVHDHGCRGGAGLLADQRACHCRHEGRRCARQAFWPAASLPGLVKEIRTLAASASLSIREIHRKIGKRASRGRVGEITKQVRSVARQQMSSDHRRVAVRAADRLGSTKPEAQKPMSPHVPLCR